MTLLLSEAAGTGGGGCAVQARSHFRWNLCVHERCLRRGDGYRHLHERRRHRRGYVAISSGDALYPGVSQPASHQSALRHQHALARRPHLRHLSVPRSRGDRALPVPPVDGAACRGGVGRGQAADATARRGQDPLPGAVVQRRDDVADRRQDVGAELLAGPQPRRDHRACGRGSADGCQRHRDARALRGWRRPRRYDPVADRHQAEESGEPGAGAWRGVAARRDRGYPGCEHQLPEDHRPPGARAHRPRGAAHRHPGHHHRRVRSVPHPARRSGAKAASGESADPVRRVPVRR